jgi:hypothetical protein
MFIQENEKPYLLSIIDKTAIKQNKGIVWHKTIFMQVIIGKYIKKISLDIIKISNY